MALTPEQYNQIYRYQTPSVPNAPNGKWSYDQAVGQFGNTWSTPYNPSVGYANQNEMLQKTGWSLPELQNSMNYYQGVARNNLVRSGQDKSGLIDPYYDKTPAPDYVNWKPVENDIYNANWNQQNAGNYQYAPVNQNSSITQSSSPMRQPVQNAGVRNPQAWNSTANPNQPGTWGNSQDVLGAAPLNPILQYMRSVAPSVQTTTASPSALGSPNAGATSNPWGNTGLSDQQLIQSWQNAPGINNVVGGKYYDASGGLYRNSWPSYWQEANGWYTGDPTSGAISYYGANSPWASAGNRGGTSPTLNVGSTSSWNPQDWGTTDNSNPFINSSGGFAYDALPGMYNYLQKYLSSNANKASGVNDYLTSYLGGNLTSGYPSGMSQYLQQLLGGVGSGQYDLGTGAQGNALNTLQNLSSGQGTSTPIQNQVSDTLSQMLSGSGLTPAYVQAMRESVLQPSQEALVGSLNRSGQGVVSPSSGLQQELLRRNEKDFNNQLISQGYQNYNNLLGQGLAAGGQSFGQGLNLAGQYGNLGQQGMSNSLNAAGQGQNLLNSYLSSLLGLQGNAQNYTTALTGQYGNLSSNLLNNKTQADAAKQLLSSQKNSAIGSALANLLGGKGAAGSGAGGDLGGLIKSIGSLFGGNNGLSDMQLGSLWNQFSDPNSGSVGGVDSSILPWSAEYPSIDAGEPNAPWYDFSQWEPSNWYSDATTTPSWEEFWAQNSGTGQASDSGNNNYAWWPPDAQDSDWLNYINGLA